MAVEPDHDGTDAPDEGTHELAIDRTLRKSGDSVVVSLPPAVLDATGMGEGTEVAVVADLLDGDIELRQKGEE